MRMKQAAAALACAATAWNWFAKEADKCVMYT